MAAGQAIGVVLLTFVSRLSQPVVRRSSEYYKLIRKNAGGEERESSLLRDSESLRWRSGRVNISGGGAVTNGFAAVSTVGSLCQNASVKTVYLGCLCLAALGLSNCGTQGTPTTKSTALVEGDCLQGLPSDRVYLISAGQKHYIQTPATLHALDVVGQLKSVPDSMLNSMPTGIELPPLTANAIQKVSTGQIYLLRSGKRHYIPDPDTLKALGLTGKVQAVKDDAVDAIPLGAPVQRVSARHAK